MKTQKLKVTLNEIKRMKELAGINSLSESREEYFLKQQSNPKSKTGENIPLNASFHLWQDIRMINVPK